jgi:hypothetical protein
MARQAQAAPLGRSNKRMHATRNSAAFKLNLGGGRVMRGVMLLVLLIAAMTAVSLLWRCGDAKYSCHRACRED